MCTKGNNKHCEGVPWSDSFVPKNLNHFNHSHFWSTTMYNEKIITFSLEFNLLYGKIRGKYAKVFFYYYTWSENRLNLLFVLVLFGIICIKRVKGSMTRVLGGK